MRRPFMLITSIALLTQCQRGPTQARLSLTTNMPCPVQGIRITATSGESSNNVLLAESSYCNGGALGDLYVHPATDSATHARVRVVLGVHEPASECSSDFTGCIEQKRGFSYRDHEVLEVPMPLDQACLGVRCDDMHTCHPKSGRCVSMEVSCDAAGVCALPEDPTSPDDADAGPAIPTPAPELVAAGDNFACSVVAADRSVRCWGINLSGQHGDGTTSGVAVSQTLDVNQVTVLAARSASACALTESGEIWCWGAATIAGFGGDGGIVARPRRAPLGPASHVTVGSVHACAVLRDSGALYCWGSNDSGQLGPTTSQLSSSALPVMVPSIPAMRRASAGQRSTCGVTTQNEVYCWGRNQDGECGIPPGSPLPPVRIDTGAPALDVRSGGQLPFACQVELEGGARCWGNNQYGTLGSGGDASAWSLPRPVLAPREVVGVAVGVLHACAHTFTPGVSCWGANVGYALGTDAGDRSTTPLRIASLDGFDVQSVAAGGYFSCARARSGAVKCWGSNTGGQLGPGATGSASAEAISVLGLP